MANQWLRSDLMWMIWSKAVHKKVHGLLDLFSDNIQRRKVSSGPQTSLFVTAPVSLSGGITAQAENIKPLWSCNILYRSSYDTRREVKRRSELSKQVTLMHTTPQINQMAVN